jgi:hypothetical protein
MKIVHNLFYIHPTYVKNETYMIQTKKTGEQ